MMDELWLGQLMARDSQAPARPQRDPTEKIRDLELEIARIKLLNQALWELIRDRARLTDADLEAKANEIDMRDGVQDGRISNVAVRCPQCNRVSSSKHYRCLYCGLEFEKPVMG